MALVVYRGLELLLFICVLGTAGEPCRRRLRSWRQEVHVCMSLGRSYEVRPLCVATCRSTQDSSQSEW